jgi:ADP-ribose pyrophosphatase YjhB (NUDIX family)
MNYMPWKVPGGLSELGESISTAAEREVLEETGIPTKFHSILSFRHTHGLANGRSDLYFVCRLDPIEGKDENGNVVIPEPCAQACEIEATRWVPLSEYRAMVDGVDGQPGHPMMSQVMKVYDQGLRIEEKQASSVVPGRKPNPLYMPVVLNELD